MAGDFFKLIEESLDEVAKEWGWKVTNKVEIAVFSKESEGKKISVTALINNRVLFLSDYSFLWNRNVKLISRGNNVSQHEFAASRM